MSYDDALPTTAAADPLVPVQDSGSDTDPVHSADAGAAGTGAASPMSSSQRSAGEEGASVDNPTSDDPTSDNLTGDSPAGDGPTGDSPTGDSPTGDSPTGDGPTDVSPTDVSPTDVSPTDVSPTDVSPTGVSPVPAEDSPDADAADPDAQEAAAEVARTQRSADRARARELFAVLAAEETGSHTHQRARHQLIEMHRPLVEYLARRFRNRGEPLDDLVQVATIGLIKSVDRFDLERGVEFSTYATPTVVGEIKRHFRDKGWAIRVPRRLQELKLSLTKATSDLSQKLGRSPTVAELAGYLGLSEEEVLEGLESANAYSAVSLDAPDGGDDESPAVADSLGFTDEGLEGVEYRESLKPLLEKLPAREKKILLLRFFGSMTQSQIAAELGISQMHVSRLLARTLSQLREGLLSED